MPEGIISCCTVLLDLVSSDCSSNFLRLLPLSSSLFLSYLIRCTNFFFLLFSVNLSPSIFFLSACQRVTPFLISFVPFFSFPSFLPSPPPSFSFYVESRLRDWRSVFIGLRSAVRYIRGDIGDIRYKQALENDCWTRLLYTFFRQAKSIRVFARGGWLQLLVKWVETIAKRHWM